MFIPASDVHHLFYTESFVLDIWSFIYVKVNMFLAMFPFDDVEFSAAISSLSR